MKTFKHALSLFLALVMMVSVGSVIVFPTFADDNVAKIGDTEYATLEAAIDAAADGDTITLLRDATTTFKDKRLDKNLTIDGTSAKYTWTSNGGFYIFHVYKSLTLKNMKISSSHGFRQRNTAGVQSNITLDNVEYSVGGGLLVNIQGEDKTQAQSFNIINSTISKWAGLTGGDPVLATYNAGSDITINIENSTINQTAGATNHVGNGSMLYCYNAANVALNVKGTSKLNYNPIGKSNDVQPLFCVGKSTVTMTLEAGVELNLLGSSVNSTSKNAFTHKNETAGSLAIVDNGAKWNATKAVAALGIQVPYMDSYNGESLTSWSVWDGETRFVATGSPFKYNATADTVQLSFSTYSFDLATDFVMQKGASIRTKKPIGMSFGATLSAGFVEMLNDLGVDVTYGLYLVKKSDLEATKLGGDSYRMNLLADRYKIAVNRILWSEDNDGNKTMYGCVYDLDATEEYVMIASIAYVSGGEETIYYTEISDTDHVRSVAGIASEAIKDSEYADNAYLKALAALASEK